MSSNHKAPLAAFMVVAIACVVVLATNSMRSYARDAWRTFAAPVVSGLQLVETERPEHSEPRQPSAPATSAAAEVAPITVVHRSPKTVHGVRQAHAAGASSATITAVKSSSATSQPQVPSQPEEAVAATPAAQTSSPVTSSSTGWSAGDDDHFSHNPLAAMAQQVLTHHDNGQHVGWSHGAGSSHGASGWAPFSSHADSHAGDHHDGYHGWSGSTTAGNGHSGSSHSAWSTPLAVAASLSTANGLGHHGGYSYGSSHSGYGSSHGSFGHSTFGFGHGGH